MSGSYREGRCLVFPKCSLFRRSWQVPELEAGRAFPCPPGHSWHHLQSRARGTWLDSRVDRAPWTEVSWGQLPPHPCITLQACHLHALPPPTYHAPASPPTIPCTPTHFSKPRTPRPNQVCEVAPVDSGSPEHLPAPLMASALIPLGPLRAQTGDWPGGLQAPLRGLHCG